MSDRNEDTSASFLTKNRRNLGSTANDYVDLMELPWNTKRKSMRHFVKE